MSHGLRAFVGLAILWLLSACLATIPDDSREHIVMFDREGWPIDPVEWRKTFFGSSLRMEEEEFDDYVEHGVLAGLARWRDQGKPRRIVLFIHGGLNSKRTSIDRAVKLRPRIEEDGTYPIFINWQSSLQSSYFLDHLLFVRRGNYHPLIGPFLSPFYLVVDLGRIVLRAPIVTVQGAYRTYQRMTNRGTPATAQTVAAELRERYERDPNDPGTIPIYVGADHTTRWESTWKWTKFVLTTPTRLVSAPIIDAVGSSSWNMMLRRTSLLFEREEDSLAGYPDAVEHSDLLRFLADLDDFVEEDGQPWEVVLVGHSMGTIVVNGILRHAAQDLERLPDFAHVVYMASACSLADFEASALPYAQLRAERAARTGAPPCDLYLLTLAQRAELQEENAPEAFGLAPRGSLLIWIDDYLAQPNSEVDHTLGRFTNLMLAVHRIPAELRARFHVKAFDVGGSSGKTSPQQHGDFSEFPFWRQGFWDPAVEPGSDPALTRIEGL